MGLRGFSQLGGTFNKQTPEARRRARTAKGKTSQPKSNKKRTMKHTHTHGAAQHTRHSKQHPYARTQHSTSFGHLLVFGLLFDLLFFLSFCCVLFVLMLVSFAFVGVSCGLCASRCQASSQTAARHQHHHPQQEQQPQQGGSRGELWLGSPERLAMPLGRNHPPWGSNPRPQG